MPTHACSPKWQVLQRECLPETQARMGGRRGQGWGGALHSPPSQTAITIQQPSASHPERNPTCAASPQANGDLCDPCLSSALIKAFPLTCWCTRWGLEVVNDRLRVCSILGMQNYIAWYLGKHIRGLSISLTVHKGGTGCYQKIPLVIVLISCNSLSHWWEHRVKVSWAFAISRIKVRQSLGFSFTNRGDHKLQIHKPRAPWASYWHKHTTGT